MSDVLLPSLDIATLTAAYEAGTKPADVLAACHARMARDETTAIWISRRSLEELLASLAAAEQRRARGEKLPLFGIPFAVKDNIDVAGLATTAACPGYRYLPAKSARVVEKLEAAGAIVLGKTNLDQFATGLTGTRSPYGTPSSVFDPEYISGGSSSGSAVAVANGLVSFALGTDTAGSGRVPAAFNNIVGLKPTKGWLSTTGMVPACRSLDCVSVFAGTVEDALQVIDVAAGFDADDPFSRSGPEAPASFPEEGFRFGVPAALDFFGDDAAAALFEHSIARLVALGGIRVPIDFAPFRDTGLLLYNGPWVAERLVAIKEFMAASAAELLPITRDIIRGAGRLGATDVFEGIYLLASLARRAEAEWARMDIMLLPTAGTIYKIADVQADPIRLNSQLGLYTNFANLLDLSAAAVPAGFRPNGLPFGVTLMARAFQDRALAAIAARLHHGMEGATLGGTGRALPAERPFSFTPSEPETVALAVCGAHLSGQPLNRELTALGARLIRTARTASGYSFYALQQGAIAKPGLVFDGEGQGGIEVEIWSLSPAGFGAFVAAIPPPLGIGTIALADGSSVKGFLCEGHAIMGAENITAYGGWRAFLAKPPHA